MAPLSVLLADEGARRGLTYLYSQDGRTCIYCQAPLFLLASYVYLLHRVYKCLLYSKSYLPQVHSRVEFYQ
jgi:hypothetical protein